MPQGDRKDEKERNLHDDPNALDGPEPLPRKAEVLEERRGVVEEDHEGRVHEEDDDQEAPKAPPPEETKERGTVRQGIRWSHGSTLGKGGRPGQEKGDYHEGHRKPGGKVVDEVKVEVFLEGEPGVNGQRWKHPANRAPKPQA